MKIGFVSLGCSKNQMDTEVMLSKVLGAGYEITPEDTEADVIIVNTCSFIDSAKKESIDNIIDLAWLKKNHKLKGIVVTGCLAQRYQKQVFEELPEVDALLGVGSINNIVDAIKAVEKKEKYTSFESTEELQLGGDRILTTPEYSSYIKISEGCDNNCTYCAIPMIRGKFRSRTIEDIVTEAKQLEKLGVKELCIIAQDTTRYGIDLYGEYKLPELLQEITKNTSIPWIRLLYCYPEMITAELVNEIRDNERIVKYIDIPIQHISDKVMRRMNRRGNSSTVRNTIKTLRENIPGIILRTTFIVGFPGETEEDFTELLEFVRDTKFDRLGVFTYSREEGTPAHDFEDQIDEQLKQDRSDMVMEVQYGVMTENAEAMVGKTLKVLCEDYDPVSEAHFGRSYAEAPEIDGKIYFKSKKRVAPGTFVDVKIKEVIDYDLFGDAVGTL